MKNILICIMFIVLAVASASYGQKGDITATVPDYLQRNYSSASSPVTVTGWRCGMTTFNGHLYQAVCQSDYSSSHVYQKKSGLAPVATTGAYSDLTGKPIIPAAQVSSDWNATGGVSQILNKPLVGGATSYSNISTAYRTGSAAATTKATPVSDDRWNFFDSITGGWRQLSWGNIVSTLTTEFNSLYQAAGTYLTGITVSSPIIIGGTPTVPTLALGSVPFKNLSAATRAGLGSAAYTSSTDYDPAGAAAVKDTTAKTGILKGNGSVISAATNADLPVMSATVGGAVPTPPNDATKFLNGAAGFTAPAGTYSLPTATSSTLGGVKPDGTSILNTAGVLSATAASVGAANVAGSSSQAFATSTLTSTVTANTTQNTIHTLLGSGNNALTLGYEQSLDFQWYNSSYFGGRISGYVESVTGNGKGGLKLYASQGNAINATPGITIASTNAVSINAGTNVVYRCTGATNLGMLTINNALCVTGYATTSLKLD